MLTAASIRRSSVVLLVGRALFAAAVASAFSGLVGCRSDRPRPAASASRPYPAQAPGFALSDRNGRSVALADFRGKAVILNFWATWCNPCVREVPHLIEIHERHKDEGLVVVGISLDRDADDVGRFVAERNITYPILHGELSALQQVAEAYGGIEAIPTTFLIRRDGRIADRLEGYRDEATWEELAASILSTP
jgi:peroxiredoxin